MADDAKENVDDLSVERLNVRELKTFLQRHDEIVSGNKDALIERAKGAIKLGIPDKLVSKQAEEKQVSQRRVDKLTVNSTGESFPDPGELKSGWTDDYNGIPSFTVSDIYNYMVFKMNASMQIRSKIYYEDRHVHSVLFHSISNDATHCFVKCKVIPSAASTSMKANPDHQVWLCLAKMTGQVLSANCSCTAG